MEFDHAQGFGQVVRAARKAKELSQEELAALVGVSQPSVSAWEAERSFPTTPLLLKLARLLDLDPGAMVELIGSAEPASA